jgi:hypothetical protein
MSARADGAVEIASAVAWLELGEYLGQEDRLMKPAFNTVRSRDP